MSLFGGFASRQCVGSRSGSLHPNHWSLTSPGLVPASLGALPPTRAAPARACSSFVLRHSSILSYWVRAAENSHRQGPEVCPSRQARDFEAVTGLTNVAISTIHPRRRQMSNSLVSPPVLVAVATLAGEVFRCLDAPKFRRDYSC